jgi:NADPH-dependent 2,4-dienoyl-CoA reductase/sulfur reductase-like enzyme
MGPACASLHTTHGTDLRCGVTATAIEGNGKVERVTLSDGTTLDADLVVVGIGTVPCTDWLAESGVQIADGIVADDTLATTAPGVYAAGDVVRWRNPAFDTSMRLEHWTSAAEQGALAARNALDPSAAKPYSTVPYFWSDWYGTRIQFVGVAGDADVTVVDGDIESHRFVALYHRGDRLVGALTLDRPTEIMKYRGLIACRVSWSDALAFAGTRKAARDNRGAAPV